jgi:valyl-tRNA synthetase
VNEAAKALYEFFWHKFCDWYIEISKTSNSGAAAQVIFTVFREFLKLLHPFMPFISEHLFKELKKQIAPSLPESILCETFAPLQPEGTHTAQAAPLRKLIDFVVSVRSLKKYLDIPSSEKIYLEADAEEESLRESLFANREWIVRLARLSGLDLRQDKSVLILSEAGFMIYFKEDKETMARYRRNILSKIEKIQEQEAHYKKKLSDKDFLSKAPAELVQSQKDKYQELRNDLAVLKKIGVTLE